MANIKERDIQAGILDYLRLRRIFAWRNNSGAMPIGSGALARYIRIGMKGLPDIIGVLPDGKFLGIEVKGPKGIVSQEQSETLRRMHETGACAFVARSLDDVIRTLEQYGY